ncbi:TetR/AcrR family transcriptional regulator [Plastorhodobacter daqingensis]|uniref:TetR/AcrR family transcriptional regulator n=1 Tax=Plastorhodobacter daqingensis TaxID=1387281 RepID=A0ABW2UTC6_9RHOB
MTALTTSDGAAIRKGRKYDQVLEGARRIFLRDGFEGASVDEIAREAGVSKATLYSYFPDKRLLFLEMARLECLRQADEPLDMTERTAPPRVVLTRAARRIIEFFTSEFGRQVFRICVAESDRFPALGCQFYESGPKLARERIALYLRQAAARGELRIEDFELAADQFAELCKVDLFPRMICGVAPAFREPEIERVIHGAVEMFLARYGVADKAGSS